MDMIKSILLFERNKTSSFVLIYYLYIYFLGLSLRDRSRALTVFKDEKKGYVSI